MLIKRTLMLAAAALFVLAGVTFASAQDKNPHDLQMILIDTEGGASTLFITPAGESLLIDTGYPDNDRDAE